jgi:hypothetical protein
MDVVVVVGSIIDVEIDADIVVVSANASLQLEGRAGAALVERGGDRITAALDARARRSNVEVGDIVFTEAGRHPRISSIAWAVIRDYRRERPVIDDEVAVRRAADALWAAIPGRLVASSPVKLAIVPLAAVELGPERSAAIVAESLAACSAVHKHLQRVSFVTHRPADGVAMQRGIRASFPDVRPARVKPVPAERRLPQPTPEPEPPPPPPPPRQTPSPPQPPATQRPNRSPKNLNAGSVVIEHYGGSARVAPVGCGGHLFRVRRRDTSTRFGVSVAGVDAVTDLAVDGVPVAGEVMLVDGAHVVTCRVRSTAPLCVKAELTGVRQHWCAEGRYSADEPPAGWRDPDFDDESWAALSLRKNAHGYPQGLAPAHGTVADTTVWLRLRVTTGPGGTG